MSPLASKGDEIARNQSVGFVLRIQPVDATGGYCAVADIPDYPPSEITSSYSSWEENHEVDGDSPVVG